MTTIRVLYVILCHLGLFASPFSLAAEEFSPENQQLVKDTNLKTANKNNIHHEPPQYMLDLYNEIADIDGVTKHPLPYEAKVARAIKIKKGGFKNEFKFSLTGMPSDESIIEAEFHMYHHPLKTRQRKLNLPNEMYQLLLYSEAITGPVLVSTHELTNHAFGWRVFSVGPILKQVRSHEGESVTFYFKMQMNDGRRLHLEIYRNSYGPKAPLLVLFNANNNSSSSQLLFPNLVNNSVHHQGLTRNKRSIFEDYEDSNLIEDTVANVDGCELVPMKVDFQDIGWASWIVYPTEYNAYQCFGGCVFPLGQDLDPTNHATVQSILHFSQTSANVQHPSCVPTAYTSLTLLHYDEEENVILKQFDHMVATDCGCR